LILSTGKKRAAEAAREENPGPAAGDEAGKLEMWLLLG
jgi:hypothetical protein